MLCINDSEKMNCINVLLHQFTLLDPLGILVPFRDPPKVWLFPCKLVGADLQLPASLLALRNPKFARCK
jgi:hypothetical protein